MRNVSWPAFAKVADKVLHVRPHSRGFGSVTGFGVFEKGPGARWAGVFSVPAMCAENALRFRAFLHSLRGRAGSFSFTLRSEPEVAAIYTDGTRYADGTTYTDIVTASAFITADAAKGDEVVTIDGTSGIPLTVGDFVRIGDSATGQLVRVVAIDGYDYGIRPALRSAATAGTAFEFANVTGEFRTKNAPAISIVQGGRSQPIDIEIEEFY